MAFRLFEQRDYIVVTGWLHPIFQARLRNANFREKFMDFFFFFSAFIKAKALLTRNFRRAQSGEWASVILMKCCANKCLVNEY